MTGLDDVEKVPGLPGHKFVYLHLSSPHPPWVIGPDGKFKVEDEDPGYKDAITYLDNRLPVMIQKIIAQSSVPPVIILMGDHGTETDQNYGRLLNLNAIYLPGDGKKLLYPTITPVNTFRLIFNAYFGGQYKMLDDHSYLLGEDDHRNLTTISPICIQ